MNRFLYLSAVTHSSDCQPKDHNSVVNLRNMTLNNPNVDLVNDNVYTKFG